MGRDRGLMAAAVAKVVPVIYGEAGGLQAFAGSCIELALVRYITVPVSSIRKLQGHFGPQYCL